MYSEDLLRGQASQKPLDALDHTQVNEQGSDLPVPAERCNLVKEEVEVDSPYFGHM